MSATAPIGLMALPVEILERIRDEVAAPWSQFAPPLRTITTVSRLEGHRDRMNSVGPYRRSPLVRFSETCSWIRAVCCPRMFNILTMRPNDHSLNGSPYGPGGLPPRAVFPYVVKLGITLPDFPMAGWGVDQFKAMLRSMPNLTEILWCRSLEPLPLGPYHFRMFFQAPALQTLIIGDLFRVISKPDPAYTYAAPASLRVLDLSHRNRKAVDDLDSERVLIESLLRELRPQLEVLRIPAETCRLSFLAASTWPELHELAIVGRMPRLDAPLAEVLSAMLNLRVLTVLRLGLDSWILWPAEVPASSLTMPALERLTISNLDPADRAVHHLSASASLTELSLRDTPRYYTLRPRQQSYAALMTAGQALDSIQSLQALGTLTRLELVFREDGNGVNLISLIGGSCPNLSFLELHRYAQDEMPFMEQDPTADDIPMDAFVDALSSLRKLRTLRLNLDLWIVYHAVDYLQYAIAAQGSPYIESQARRVATTLYWLDTVSFLTLGKGYGVVWRTWYVTRVPEPQSTWEVDEELLDM